MLSACCQRHQQRIFVDARQKDVEPLHEIHGRPDLAMDVRKVIDAEGVEVRRRRAAGQRASRRRGRKRLARTSEDSLGTDGMAPPVYLSASAKSLLTVLGRGLQLGADAERRQDGQASDKGALRGSRSCRRSARAADGCETLLTSIYSFMRQVLNVNVRSMRTSS